MHRTVVIRTKKYAMESQKESLTSSVSSSSSSHKKKITQVTIFLGFFCKEIKLYNKFSKDIFLFETQEDDSWEDNII